MNCYRYSLRAQKLTIYSYFYSENKFQLFNKFIHSSTNTVLKKENDGENIESLIKKYEHKIVYNCEIEKQKMKLGYRRNKAFEEKQMKEYKTHLFNKWAQEPLPVSLKYFVDREKNNDPVEIQELENEQKPFLQFPFESTDKISVNDSSTHITNEEINSAQNEIAHRNEHYNATANWMTDYENYDDKNIALENNIAWKLNYGTPDPNSRVSNVPCGGCGAFLHCKDTSIPGYLPSEIFKNHQYRDGQHLKSLLCQRCHFLKYYDMALQVRVSPDDYPKILEKVKENKNALVILMVDLLDFPCSIWPNIMSIIGTKRPVIVVGNKIDLLPQDSRSLNRANILHISLISAKTGYGIEELITKLHSAWKYKGDVYLVGCTNVGKSTLFNVLLQSDYCKIKAVDLIQRATTSPWPGTTLNLLKFPILRPSGWRLYVRTKRLISLSKIASQENRLRKVQLQKTQNPKYATLMGNIERTFTAEEPLDDETKDIFAIQGKDNASGRVRMGINENDPAYKLSKWCYDTPGVIQPDQILHLLTVEEIMLTLPKQLIQPRTFSVKPGFTVFIAGLGRLDYIEGPVSGRFTVFASESLPVTICKTEDADNLYQNLIGSELFIVPLGDENRLKQLPPLLSADEINLTGIDKEISCADIVLSNAGWISVSISRQQNCKLKAWTPEKRGIFVRESILSKAVSLRGRRIRFSPAYRKSRFFVN